MKGGKFSTVISKYVLEDCHFKSTLWVVSIFSFRFQILWHSNYMYSKCSKSECSETGFGKLYHTTLTRMGRLYDKDLFMHYINNLTYPKSGLFGIRATRDNYCSCNACLNIYLNSSILYRIVGCSLQTSLINGATPFKSIYSVTVAIFNELSRWDVTRHQKSRFAFVIMPLHFSAKWKRLNWQLILIVGTFKEASLVD